MRRIVAIVLFEIACEIARSKPVDRKARANGPIGVIIELDGTEPVALQTAVLDAIDDEARRYGVRPGQRVAEAVGLLASLTVHRVTLGEIDAALGRVAEVALAFGPTAATRLCAGETGPVNPLRGGTPFDTVWLDVTGAAHLVGGEEALLAELEERILGLGYRARLSIAGGPRIAQAMARWAPGLLGTPEAQTSGRYPIAPFGSAESAAWLAPLPVQVLPIEADATGFLLRLGVFTVGDLLRLPRAALVSRLGEHAGEVIDLSLGRDNFPLKPYTPPREILEAMSFEEGIDGAEPLLFVLRGMVARAATRLAARGEACSRIEVEIPLDRSIVRLRRANLEGTTNDTQEESIGFHVDLPAPLAAEADLLRAVQTRLARVELYAPAMGFSMRFVQIVPARSVQLDLSRDRGTDPSSLPALLAELSAEIGADRIGLLAIEDAHRPEARSRLVPIAPGSHEAKRKRSRRGAGQLLLPAVSSASPADEIPSPVRLLPRPVPLGQVGKGSVIAVGPERRMFVIEEMQYLAKLDHAEWWERSPVSRDYARAWLASGEGGASLQQQRGAARGKGASGEALLFVVRRTGEVFLQGWFE